MNFQSAAHAQISKLNAKGDVGYRALLQRIEDLDGVSEVVIYGGALLDRYLDRAESSRDIDVVVSLADKSLAALPPQEIASIVTGLAAESFSH